MRKKKNEKKVNENDDLKVQEELSLSQNIMEVEANEKVDNEESSLDIEEVKNSIKGELSSEISNMVDEEINKAMEKIDKKIEEASADLSSSKEEMASYVKEQLDNENLNDYMKHRIDKGVSEAIEKANKKVIRYKNSIIIKRDIVIIILLVVCFFLGYNLYNVSNIKIDIYRERKVAENKVSETKEEKKEESEEVKEEENNEKNDLKEKKEKYSSLLSNYSLKEDSNYVKDFYEGKLSDEIKLYITLNNMSSDKIDTDDDTVYVDSNNLKEEFEKLFDGEYSAKSFKYNNLNFKYLSSKEMYIADGKFNKKKTLIKKEISGIKEDGDLVLTVVEGKVDNGKLYNILSDSEISNYDGGLLTDYEKSLTKVEYTFKNVDDKYKLSRIDVKND